MGPATDMHSSMIHGRGTSLKEPPTQSARECPLTGVLLRVSPTMDQLDDRARHIALEWLFAGRDAQKAEDEADFELRLRHERATAYEEGWNARGDHDTALEREAVTRVRPYLEAPSFAELSARRGDTRLQAIAQERDRRMLRDCNRMRGQLTGGAR